jgi:hypothetical protein
MTRFSPSGVCSWARVSPGGLGRPTRLCNERLHFEGKWGRSFTDERETAQKLKGVATRGALPRFRLRAVGLAKAEARQSSTASPDVDAHARPRGCGRSQFIGLLLGPGAFQNFLPGRALERP